MLFSSSISSPSLCVVGGRWTVARLCCTDKKLGADELTEIIQRWGLLGSALQGGRFQFQLLEVLSVRTAFARGAVPLVVLADGETVG